MTGQGWVLHMSVYSRAAQPAPPNWGWVTMERVFLLNPPLHFSEQPKKADQPDTLQSMGQRLVLQGLALESAGHATPPFLTSVITERVLVLEPVPQDLEHGE